MGGEMGVGSMGVRQWPTEKVPVEVDVKVKVETERVSPECNCLLGLGTTRQLGITLSKKDVAQIDVCKRHGKL